MKLVRIPKTNINDVWSLVKKDIDDALIYSGGHFNSDFVLETLQQDKFQLWVVWDKEKETPYEKYNGVLVTEIIAKQLSRVCHIFIMNVKNRQKFTHLIKVIEDFAKEQDCDMLELIARPGWQKILQNYKYKRTHVVLEKQIKEKT